MKHRLTALGGGVGGRRIEQKRKRTHGHGQQCGDCEVWGRRVGGGEEGIRGINGNGKNTLTNRSKI